MNVIISIFRWCVWYATNQGIETCETISRQHMCSQVHLRLRRILYIIFSHCRHVTMRIFALCVCSCWHVWTRNRKSAVKES